MNLLHLKCIFTPSNQSNSTFFNSNALSSILKYPTISLNNLKTCHLQFKWLWYLQMCTIMLNNLSNQVVFNSNNLTIYSIVHNYNQPTQINIQLHQMCIQALQTFKLTLTTSECALCTYNAPNLQISKSLKCKHRLILQTCTNAPPTRSTPKTHPNARNTQGLVPNQLAIKSLTLEFAWMGP